MRNIAYVEYARAVVENVPILPKWENQLRKDAKIKSVLHGLEVYGANSKFETVKKYIEELELNVSDEIKNYTDCMNLVEEVSRNRNISEKDLKNIHYQSSKNIVPTSRCGVYRNFTIQNGSKTDEILADTISTIEWYNGKDAAIEHPIINSAILFSQIMKIKPFENTNVFVAATVAYANLKINKYDLNGYLNFEEYFAQDINEYRRNLDFAIKEDDLTLWIEFYSYALASQASKLKESILLLSKDSKVEKVAKGSRLSARQQRIVEYLQAYGQLVNKDFSRVFPEISEDTVLRDLKVLIQLNIVEKRGSTKSSRYELK